MRIYNPTTSSGGGSGETGATGASGLNAALTFAYRLDLSGTQNLETLPSQGEIRFAGGSDPFSATHLLVHKNSIGLNNVGSIFLSLESGHLTLTSQTQPNNFATYSFSQVEDGSGLDDCVIFHVSLVGQFNTPSDDDVISFGIAVTGETGATGSVGPAGSVNYLGLWDGGTVYSVGSVVSFDGSLWYCIQYAVAGAGPFGGYIGTYWTLFVDHGEMGATGSTGATGPQGLQGPGGGGGAGGLMFYLNQATSPDSPLTGLPTSSSVVTGFAVKELGRIADTVQSTITSSHLPTNNFNIVAAFLSDVQDPNITSIPPGLWDVNFWASSTANTNNQTVIRVIAYTYNGTSKTEIASSDDMYIYDPVVIAQYTANIVVQAGIAITANDRIYIEILAKGSSNNYTVTLKFGGNTPTHMHTTIPSVSGTGLVKVVDGLPQTPATLLVAADITNKTIPSSKMTDTGVTAGTYSGITFDEAGRATATPGPFSVAPSTSIQTWATSGIYTWTKPAGAKVVKVRLLAGAGGGGSGRRGASSSSRCGGGGGAGGGIHEAFFDASVLGATETITVGAGGLGGAAVLTDNTNGNNGANGESSSFGSWLSVPGGNGGQGGLTGAPVAAAPGVLAHFGGIASNTGGAGGAGAPTSFQASNPATASYTSSTFFGPGGNGGGAGGGLNASDTPTGGGFGGFSVLAGLTGPAGAAIRSNGTAGSNPSHPTTPGTGGSGGGSSATTAAGAGGAGGRGSGGGGGGAVLNGFASGSGGPGGSGAAEITVYF